MITIRNMETSYPRGKSFRIDEVCFEKGRITSILGRNGCGKTTLLRTMTGFLPYRGSIEIDGKECRDYTGLYKYLIRISRQQVKEKGGAALLLLIFQYFFKRRQKCPDPGELFGIL